MAKIDLSFSGWICGAEVTKATDTSGNSVDVSTMPAVELVAKLKSGDLFISLGDYLYENDDEEIDLFNFEAHK